MTGLSIPNLIFPSFHQAVVPRLVLTQNDPTFHRLGCRTRSESPAFTAPAACIRNPVLCVSQMSEGMSVTSWQFSLVNDDTRPAQLSDVTPWPPEANRIRRSRDVSVAIASPEKCLRRPASAAHFEVPAAGMILFCWKIKRGHGRWDSRWSARREWAWPTPVDVITARHTLLTPYAGRSPTTTYAALVSSAIRRMMSPGRPQDDRRMPGTWTVNTS